MTFNEWLKKEKISVDFISKKLDFNAATCAKWKYGQAIPRKPDMLKIVEATKGKVTPNDFYGINQ